MYAHNALPAFTRAKQNCLICEGMAEYKSDAQHGNIQKPVLPQTNTLTLLEPFYASEQTQTTLGTIWESFPNF